VNLTPSSLPSSDFDFDFCLDWSHRNVPSTRQNGHIPFESYVYEALLVVLNTVQDQDFFHRETNLLEDVIYFQSGTIFPVEEQEVGTVSCCMTSLA
jgi:hypothetical protein